MSKSNEPELPDVQHIVVLMLENRSFDNVLGWAYASSQPSHFIPNTPMARFNGLQGINTDRYLNRVRTPSGVRTIPPIRGYRTTRINGVDYLMPPPVDPHEEFIDMSRQIYGPWDPDLPPVITDADHGNAPRGAKPTMDSFASNYLDAVTKSGSSHTDPSAVMETGTYAQTWPFGILAHAYAVSDAWYSSTPTQTNANRAFMACGTSEGVTDNNPDGVDIFKAPTIWNRLHDLGKTWKVYWENTFLPEGIGTESWTRQSFSMLSEFGDEYFPRMGQFHRDAKNGCLPFFSFLEPSWTLQEYKEGALRGVQGSDLHPPGDIRLGLQLLSAVYSSLVTNQEKWAKTLLLVTFDEHGGTFDHVPPPDDVMPDRPHEPPYFRFDRVGPRVPTLLISPMVNAGTVFRTTKPRTADRSFPYDHTSIPATILKLAGVKSPEDYGMMDRVAVAPTFEGVLTRATPRSDGVLGMPDGHEVAFAASDPSNLVHYGDAFYLVYAGSGPLSGAFVTGGEYLGSNYLWLNHDKSKALEFRFTLGYSGKPTPFPSDTFVRTTGMVYIQIHSHHAPDAVNEGYVQLFDSTLDTYLTFGKDKGWWFPQWYISHANRERLGWGLEWDSIVTLEEHAYDSVKHWLPRKMRMQQSGETYYVSAGVDADFDDPAVGRWKIVRA